MYNSCYYSELEMNEIAETLLDIFRKNEKNDRQVAFVFAFEIIYLFIYLIMQPVNTLCSILIKNLFLCNSHFYSLVLLLLLLLLSC